MTGGVPATRGRGAAARLAAVAVAVCCAVVGIAGLRSDSRCAAVLERAQRLTPASPAAEGPAVARQAVARCASASRAVEVAVLLSGSGRRADGVAVARGLARREPEDYLGWYALGSLDDDRAGARAALERARALNPSVSATPP